LSVSRVGGGVEGVGCGTPPPKLTAAPRLIHRNVFTPHRVKRLKNVGHFEGRLERLINSVCLSLFLFFSKDYRLWLSPSPWDSLKRRAMGLPNSKSVCLFSLSLSLFLSVCVMPALMAFHVIDPARDGHITCLQSVFQR